MINYDNLAAGLLVGTLALGAAGCAQTIQGAKQDTERAVENTGAAMETVDVKAALIADGRVDASNINVDTSAAERIARDNAKGYTISNQLTVVPKQ